MSCDRLLGSLKIVRLKSDRLPSCHILLSHQPADVDAAEQRIVCFEGMKGVSI